MTTKKQGSRRDPRRAIPRDQFNFDEHQQLHLKRLGLSADAVAALEQATWQEWAFIHHGRSAASAKQRARQLEQLKKALLGAIDAFDRVDEYTLRMNFDLWIKQMFFKDSVKEILTQIEESMQQKGKPRNVQTDLDVLAYDVAKILLKSGFDITRHGGMLEIVLRTVFESIGESESSIRAAIDRAWTTSAGEGRRTISCRPYTIEELILRGGDDEDPDPDFFEQP